MSVGVLVPEKIKCSRRLRRVAWTVSGLMALLLIFRPGGLTNGREFVLRWRRK